MMRKLTEEQKRQKNIIDYHSGKVGRETFLPESEKYKTAWDFRRPQNSSRKTARGFRLVRGLRGRGRFDEQV